MSRPGRVERIFFKGSNSARLGHYDDADWRHNSNKRLHQVLPAGATLPDELDNRAGEIDGCHEELAKKVGPTAARQNE